MGNQGSNAMAILLVDDGDFSVNKEEVQYDRYYTFGDVSTYFFTEYDVDW